MADWLNNLLCAPKSLIEGSPQGALADQVPFHKGIVDTNFADLPTSAFASETRVTTNAVWSVSPQEGDAGWTWARFQAMENQCGTFSRLQLTLGVATLTNSFLRGQLELVTTTITGHCAKIFTPHGWFPSGRCTPRCPFRCQAWWLV